MSVSGHIWMGSPLAPSNQFLSIELNITRIHDEIGSNKLRIVKEVDPKGCKGEFSMGP